MRLRVLAIGQKMPAWVDQGVEEYARRMPREISVEWLDIPPAKRGSATREKYRVQEAEAIEAKLSGKDYVVALDISGKAVSTELIAERFDQWQMQGEQISIVIGGPDGLHPNILKGAKERWSLGQVTLPHPLVRVILAEQLYRAWSVQAGHPYHRGS
ncbi:MAG: 23S rRNA (pseudouridine(1915)-N(3))-methyltransferase RlmH [Halieaceae bacterium]|jgi:23S rRNA (pseudouridine1915-N3)-methyltransferase|nr:MAG: 23S rRNA (pseudouridine(1915)-N(3))-methyltransferase RlmH [Halieaceae bacterium]